MMIFKRTSPAAARKSSAGLGVSLAVLTLAVWADTSAADKLVDPDSVAPEYRAAAEKRRAEQLKLLQCSKKADEAKVPRRDRAARISECLER
jgi:hypothetical protein